MSNPKTYHGRCFCGAVEFEVSGEPFAMGYCHCESCRQWSASPLTAFALWPPASVKITEGANQVGVFKKTPKATRKWCTACGGHIMTESPQHGFSDVYPVLIPKLAFEPKVHVHYQETVLRVKDGLPKLKDVPATSGGSGEMMSE